MRVRAFAVLVIVALLGWGATAPYQQVISLCPPNVCLGSGNSVPVQFWADGKAYLQLNADGTFTAINGGAISASGGSITNLNASNLSTGTVPDARFPATLPALSGVNLTALNATNLASGTVGFAVGGNRMSETAKASNEIVNNSSTLQSDDELTFAIASGNAFEIEYIVLWDGAANADIKFNLSVPANVTYSIGAGCLATTAAAIEGDFRNSSTSSSGADIICGAAGAASFLQTTLKARVQSSTGAGNVVIQWAQNAAQNSDTTIYSGSYLRRFRVQ